MKKKMRRLISLLLSICMISFVAFPINVFSAQIESESVGYAYGDFYYNLDANNNAIITKYVGDDMDVVIPSIIKTYNVTEINQNVFKGNTSINSVTINENLININANAFYQCTQLKSVKLPDSLTTIGNYAFYGCDNLKEIEISSNVTSIGTKALGYNLSGFKYTDFQIIGYANSYVYTYAKENNLNFKDKSQGLSYVEITNETDLFKFAERVNSGEINLNAKLVKNITITSGKNWTPIGTEEYKYNGIFEGENHLISGLYFKGKVESAGFFAYTDKNAVVRNLLIYDFTLDNKFGFIGYFGSICGYNSGIIENCSVTNSLKMTGLYPDEIKSAVICGYNNGKIIRCSCKGKFYAYAGICYDNYGEILECSSNGHNEAGFELGLAGICFENFGLINNCYNTASMSVWDYLICGICVDNHSLIVNCMNFADLYDFLSVDVDIATGDGKVYNCYYKYYSVHDQEHSTEWSTYVMDGVYSGEYAYLLSRGCTVDGVKYDGSIWGQDLSIEKSQPTFNEKKVYLAYSSTDCDAVSKYTNNPDVIQSKDSHVEAQRIENEVPATCTAKGSYDVVTYCTVCNNELSRKTKWVDKIIHNNTANTATRIDDYVAPTCFGYGKYTEITYCKECNVDLSRKYIVVDPTGHKPIVLGVKKPTCTEQGYTACQCAVCGRTYRDNYTDIIPHNYVNGKCSGCDAYLESDHNYKNNTDTSWIINCNGAYSVTLTFSELTSTETNWDFIYMYDVNGKEVGKYSGTELANKSVIINGDTVTIRLKVDDNNTDYGFKLTEIIPTYSTILADTNGDMLINISDATHIQKYCSGMIEFDDRHLSRADVNKDGIVNVLDATFIQKYAVGLITEL